VPKRVSAYVRGVLELPDDVALEQDAERTAKRRRQVCATPVGCDLRTPLGPRDRGDRDPQGGADQGQLRPALINVTLEQLVRDRCELTGYTRWTRWSVRSVPRSHGVIHAGRRPPGPFTGRMKPVTIVSMRNRCPSPPRV
jgi:hypothetical protein